MESRLESCCLAAFGIPEVGLDKLDKLKSTLSKLFSKFGEFNAEYPLNANNVTKGYCFVKYNSKDAAEAARLVVDSYQFGKNHVLNSHLMTDFEEIVEDPDKNWKTPEKLPFHDFGNLWSWTEDDRCREQFVVQVLETEKDETAAVMAVYYNGVRGPSLASDKRKNWSENHCVEWSPYGSYLTTVQKKDVVLWGGSDFKCLRRFSHKGADFVAFSPKESFITSVCSQAKHQDSEYCVKIFDVVLNELKMTLLPPGERFEEWPFVKWSSDEKFFAYRESNEIRIFNSDTFTLCEPKHLHIDGLIFFEWNPIKNWIAYYTKEMDDANAPPVIGIMALPSQQKLRTHHIYGVMETKLYWHDSGDYLAAIAKRALNLKKKKTAENTVYCLDIFDCSGKEVSIIEQKFDHSDGAVIDFGWEPKGLKCCVLLDSGFKATPRVYQLEKDRGELQLVSTLDPAAISFVRWAPSGQWLCLFGNKDNGSAVLLFVDASGTQVKKIREVEHTAVKQVCWDPSGRYCVSMSASGTTHVHTFQGRELYKQVHGDELVNFLWRPRPPVFLSETKIKEIRKTLKAYSQEFEEKDRLDAMSLSEEQLAFRRDVMKQFNAIREENYKFYMEEQSERAKLRCMLLTDIGQLTL
ncbi:eukaryotic translation initiation factor eIF2A domain-containing protein [Ditylenchus destructor]|nr:eukaryotic translation initiation factor eIF2A domain-containing protein [Ditylenchus destructor]